MLFNTYLFLFAFLPIALVGYYLFARWGSATKATVWLVITSLFFYAWYNPIYTVLIVSSILFNYLMGRVISDSATTSRRKLTLAIGVSINILLLGYFKYANFFVNNANTLFNGDFNLNTIVLPLAISFFTLQQIGYIIDVYRREIDKPSLLDYARFVTFFPQLIAGPIVRAKEMLPQVIKDRISPITARNIAVGMTVLLLGLFKKTVLADGIGDFADPIFNAASSGAVMGFFDSWTGVFAYTFQIYFDFSGYCDMAVGLGLMFGIKLPINFYSPYKATSIIDFWRRWHITLSRFIQDYLYIPLGGNRKGFPRQLINVVVVMVIAGFWHGAGWTFVIWGALHGVYLAVNHIYRRLRSRLSPVSSKITLPGTLLSVFITFMAVSVAWVFFRSDSLSTATGILKGMSGLNGFVLPTSYYASLGVFGQYLERIGVMFAPVTGFSSKPIVWILMSFVICWFTPNVQEFMSNYRPSLDGFRGAPSSSRSRLRWKPSIAMTVIVALMAMLAILGMSRVSEFIYFQF